MMGTDSAEAKMSMTTTRYTAYSAMSRAVGCVIEIMTVVQSFAPDLHRDSA